MRAAVLTGPGTPELGDFPEPTATDGCVVVRVRAAALNGLDRATAAGNHFLSPRAHPAVAGRDGVGTLDDGRRVYFDGPVAPHGSMAERTLVRTEDLVEVPAGTDDAAAAALGNAGLAAWLPLSWRAGLRAGETVAVLGAGGAVGRLAVQAARLLGAGRVVAVDRGAEKLAQVRALGADATVDTATSTDLAADCRAAAPGGLDVVVDYLWGAPALAALHAAAPGARLVQVGTAADEVLQLPASLLRSRGLEVCGYITPQAPPLLRAEAYQRMAALVAQGRLDLPVRRTDLADVAAAWAGRAPSGTRTVLIP